MICCCCVFFALQSLGLVDISLLSSYTYIQRLSLASNNLIGMMGGGGEEEEGEGGVEGEKWGGEGGGGRKGDDNSIVKQTNPILHFQSLVAIQLLRTQTVEGGSAPEKLPTDNLVATLQIQYFNFFPDMGLFA